MDSLTPYLLAALALAAGVIGYLLRDRTARKPATEQAAAAAAELQQRQDQAAATRAAAAIEARDQAATAAKQRQEVGTRASEGVDRTLERLGAEPERVRQESAAGPAKRPGPG